MNHRRRHLMRCFRLLSGGVVLAMLFALVGGPAWAAGVIQYEVQRLAPDSLEYSDHFGYELAVSGDTLMVGSENYNGNGAVYVFERGAGGLWVETTMLLPDISSENAFFGTALALDGDTALIGAANHTNGAVPYAGVVYEYRRDASGQWNQVGWIVPGDPLECGNFGYHLALDGDRLAVSAIYSTDYGITSLGSVYLFERGVSGAWVQAAKLQLSNPAVDDDFGSAVALSGDWLFVAERGGDTETLPNAGAVYIYERDENGQWNQAARLMASDPDSYAYFGTSMALQGDRAAIGALGSAVDVFERDDSGSWNRVVKLMNSDPTWLGDFGYSVAMNHDELLVGATGQRAGGYEVAGAVYLFQRDAGGTWVEAVKMLASDPATSDFFGRAVVFSDDQAVVGQFPHTGGYGAVYLYDLPPLPPPVISEPVEASYVRTGTPTFRGRSATGSTTYVKEGANLLCTAKVDALGNWSCTPESPLADGPHTITATASNRSDPAAVSFFVSAQSLTITHTPQDARVCAGALATFTAAASGYPVPGAQWQVSTDGGAHFDNLQGETTDTLAFTALVSQHGRQYRVLYENLLESAASAAAVLTVDQPRSIHIQASQAFYAAGDTVMYTAEISGFPAAEVRWQVSGVGDDTWADVSDAAGTILSFTMQPDQRGYRYRAVSENSCGLNASNVLHLQGYTVYVPWVSRPDHR